MEVVTLVSWDWSWSSIAHCIVQPASYRATEDRGLTTEVQYTTWTGLLHYRASLEPFVVLLRTRPSHNTVRSQPDRSSQRRFGQRSAVIVWLTRTNTPTQRHDSALTSSTACSVATLFLQVLRLFTWPQMGGRVVVGERGGGGGGRGSWVYWWQAAVRDRSSKKEEGEGKKVGREGHTHAHIQRERDRETERERERWLVL